MAKIILAMGLCMLLVSNAQAVENRSYGDIVSDCNRLANAKKLKSRARKDFVEWCNARALQGSDTQAVRYPGCIQRASQQGLRGDERVRFTNWCVNRAQGHTDAAGERYRTCETRARASELGGRDRADSLDWCGEATQNYGATHAESWARDKTCYVRAAAGRWSSDRRREFQKYCLEGSRTLTW